MEGFEERDWTRLLQRIKDKRCTPFVGAGASAKFLPVGSEIARQWAAETGYPLEDETDLARVAQYVAVVNGDPMWPKERIGEWFRGLPTPDLSAADEPHRVLAALELPIYITTNYDGLMARALRERGAAPREAICLWNSGVKEHAPPELRADPAFLPTPATPLVYHLHGHIDVPESLVLTEDDYLDFLINQARDPELLPPYVKSSFTRASLLFVGYRIADWNFRVLFRDLVTYLAHGIKRSHVSVQTVPGRSGMTDEGERRAQEYLHEYFRQSEISVYWGRSDEFARELDRRRAESPNGG